MKYIIIIFVIFGFLSANAQSQDNWFTNKTEAQEYAAAHSANILMVFAGSDWCRPCIKFKKDILEDSSFSAYADDKLVILYLDFPSKKKNKLSKEAKLHNEALAEKYNQSGAFPKIVLLDKDMNKVKDLPYEGQSTEDFIAMMK